MAISTPVEEGPPSTPDEAILNALGDPAMRRLLLALGSSEHDVHDLVVRTGLPQSSVYRKLKEMEAAKVIRVARLAFTPDGKKVELYRSRLKEVRVRLVEGTLHLEVLTLEDSGDRLGKMWSQVRGGQR